MISNISESLQYKYMSAFCRNVIKISYPAVTIYIIGLFVGLLFGLQNYPKVEITKKVVASEYIIHNLRSSLPLYLGFLTLGTSTLLVLFAQSFILGATISASLQIKTAAEIVAAIVPHAILEIPGILFAGAAGLKIPQVLIRHLRGGNFITKQDIKDYFSLAAISVVLIIIAGFIEANITPLVIKWVS